MQIQQWPRRNINKHDAHQRSADKNKSEANVERRAPTLAINFNTLLVSPV